MGFFGSLLTRLGVFTPDDDTGPTFGAASVATAIIERGDDADRVYEGTLGEPRLIDRGGAFSEDYRIKIPVETPDDAPDVAPLEYLMPDGPDDDDSAFLDMLGEYGLSGPSDVPSLTGRPYYYTVVRGEPVALWERIDPGTAGDTE